MTDITTQNAAPEQDVLLDHDYDGIQEYDNPMPGWWLAIFYVTIAWSLFYMVALGLELINDYDAQLAQASRQLEQTRNAYASETPPVDEAMLSALLEDSDALARGAEIYSGTCAPCHGANHEGGVGPILTDDEWIHGGEMPQIFATIRDGVSDKGMPPWGPVLRQEDIASLTAYITSLQ
ncbi:nitrogen fixation protein FixP [Lujinxingia litoralis]|uniref:Nitrogen fixation protein FixP n=1 Tax=Lujinxingia litoralis TaxID=2211119 RepID=A0A328C8W8_9DELT|nr:cbb3-type cytochrome c oxidase N-terminal domain-containing protein [Lujinxingia litoralis]RAL23110.1 nitrogen fixation protein FixP [Lujinxingia litoralis]